MDELCQPDDEVFAEFERGPGAQIVKAGPSPGEPGFAGSPGGLSDGIPGLKELPVG